MGRKSARLVGAVMVLGLVAGASTSTVALGTPPAGAGAMPEQAGEASTEIIVATSADRVNGNVSSVPGLISNPGEDGISLREAFEATNNDPGLYAIHFSPEVSGKTIHVGSETGTGLPPLFGGGVSIDGDIDGDGEPDVTLGSTLRDDDGGIAIVSSGNEVRGLAIQGFTVGVLFEAIPRDDSNFPTHQTYESNVVRGLVVEDTSIAGVAFRSHYFTCTERACRTFNSWIDTTVAGNTIESRGIGVSLAFEYSIGDRAANLRVIDNEIRIVMRGKPDSLGMDFSAGAGIGSKGNRISDLLIARNSVSVPGGRGGIRLWSGESGAKANTIKRVRMIRNQIGDSGIGMGTGDAASDDLAPNLRPIRYPEENVLRDVTIKGNILVVDTRQNPYQTDGVAISNSCCGGARNRIRDIRVVGNTIRAVRRTGPFVGLAVEGGTGEGHRPTTRNSIYGMWLTGNRITATTDGTGISVVGGTGNATLNRVTCIHIRDNHISGARYDVVLAANANGARGNTVSPGCA